MQIRNRRDLVSGVLFAAVGAVFGIGSIAYPMGSSARPGACYFGVARVVRVVHDRKETCRPGWPLRARRHSRRRRPRIGEQRRRADLVHPDAALGIPPNAVMALMAGAMTIKGIQPGPQVMSSNPGLFWGLIAPMWVGNLMLVILNLPMIGIWIKLLTGPYRFLFPAITLFGCIGVYTLTTTPSTST